MPRYLISFDAHAMDHIPAEDMPAVADASHAVVHEAIDAGVWVFGGGLENQKASIVATDGTVTDGPFTETKELVAGFWLIQVKSREEAIEWMKRAPFQEGEIEIRQVHEAEDFGENLTPELRAQEERMRRDIASAKH